MKQWHVKFYGDSARWFADFKRGRRDTNDAKHSRRTNASVTSENIKIKYTKSFSAPIRNFARIKRLSMQLRPIMRQKTNRSRKVVLKC